MPISSKQRRAMTVSKQAAKQNARRMRSKPVLTRSMPASAFDKRVMDIVARRSEHKYVDFLPTGGAGPVPTQTFLISANLGTNDTIFCVNPMQQGTAYYNRIGRKTKTMSLRLKLNFDYAYSTNLTSYTTGNLRNQVRVCVVYDRENTGVIPTFNQIFSQTDAQGTTKTLLTTPLGLTHADRFRILLDETLELNPMSTPTMGDYNIGTGATSAVYTTAQAYFLDRFIDCSKKEILQAYQSSSNPATIADLSSGAIYLVLKALDYSVGTNEVYLRDSIVRVKCSDV